MAKLRKDVKVELKGAAAMGFAGSPVTLVIHALESAGVDWKPSFEAIAKLSRQEQKMLEDRAVKPIGFSIPAPEGYGEEEHAVLCASLAGGIREERKHKWDRRITIGSVIVATVSSIAAVVALID